MTAIEPQVSMTGRYSSKETSTLLDIHRNTLRNYTNNGDIKCGFRKPTARRFYLGSEILKFWKAQL